MSDIVERLRLLQKHQQDNDAGEAADTIEALRAENARLRNVLKPFLTRAPDTANPDDYDWLMVNAEDIRAARKALGETE